jgi:hypothetical protein
MQSNFNNREFEQFVKQNADQYRMFPSEKVWKGIHSTLHTRRRWYGIGLSLLLLTCGTVTWVMLSSTGAVNNGPGSILASIQKASEISASKSEPIKILATRVPATKRTIPFNAGITNPSIDHLLTGNTGIRELEIQLQTAIQPGIIESDVIADAAVAKPNTPLLFYKTSKIVTIPGQELLAAVNPPPTVTFEDYVRDNYPEPAGNADKKQIALSENRKKEWNEYPMTIESVVNSFTRGRKKINWQIYFAPTVSYRKLRENNDLRSSALASGSSANYVYPVLSDINNMVTHKPDMGLELGFNAGYPVSRHINLTAGVQLNVSKYDIRAFSHPGEMTTIALSSASGISNSVSTVSTFRNFNGHKQSWLHNLYTSVSFPVGAQAKLPTNSKTYVGVGGNIQPTYILGERAYLISTDFKNYAEVPWLIRRWNLATNVEIYAGFSTNNIKWKVGPQMRYQWLSSFESKYPVKEHLFDFGLKVGVLLNQ